MRSDRRCSRNGCRQPAVATLTYVYADSTAVVGPLATAREPHSYDLCSLHAGRLTAPRGWELVRHKGDHNAPMPSDDDLVALANAVREAANNEPETMEDGETDDAGAPRSKRGDTTTRGHLRVVQAEDDSRR
ncbi:DUF3499 domain-containing protein [Haloglycomyces albus]|uniref:DUF3499 domain-containing protein n=1 Tax=Haloglycomyces albus TaxID=526067 RepID=UPI00046D6D1C|nr:DUF3499 domain-containing protein [Haloglycomyces albus]